MHTPEEIRAERDLHEPWLQAQPGVVGTSITLGPDGNPCLRIFVRQLDTSTQAKIQKRLKSTPVVFEEQSEFLPYSR
jgi:hypothetical protein